jgi:uncharacterized membrane protein
MDEGPSSAGKDQFMSDVTHQYSHHVSVPSDEGIRVDKVITVRRPVSEVYSFWRRLENLPRFMRHVKSVRVHDHLHSHWVVKTVGGKELEWDAEIIEQRENEMVSWRSAPGADVDNAGSVWFKPVDGDTTTEVRVSLKYVPPAGQAGVLAAKIFNRDPESEIEEDLTRFKSLLETGELPKEPRLREWQRRATQGTRRAVQATHNYAQENPWQIVASVALISFVLGVLVGQGTGQSGRGRRWPLR